MRTRITSLLFSAVLLSVPMRAQAELVIIVNNQSALQSIDTHELSDLYLGRTRNFESGEEAIVLEQPRDSELRKKFFNSINGMPIRQVNAYWARLQFSGEIQPPIALANSQAVKNKVSQLRNAIGYIDASMLDKSVRVIQRLSPIQR